MLTNWLETLRLTQKVYQQSEERIRASLLSKDEMVVVWLSLKQAEEFNGQLTDVFSKTSESEVHLLEKSAPPMSDIYVSNEGFVKMMKGLTFILLHCSWCCAVWRP